MHKCRPSPPAFSRTCSQTPVSLSKNVPKLYKLKDSDHNQISSDNRHDTSACNISDCSLYAFSGKCPEITNWPVSPSQSDAKRRKINRPWLKCNQLGRSSRYISMQNSRLFPPSVLREMPQNLFGRTDGHTKNGYGWSGGPTGPCIGG